MGLDLRVLSLASLLYGVTYGFSLSCGTSLTGTYGFSFRLHFFHGTYGTVFVFPVTESRREGKNSSLYLTYYDVFMMIFLTYS